VIAYVRGPSGSGKSTLVEKLAADHGLNQESKPYENLLDEDGEVVNEKVFFGEQGGEKGEKRRLQIWRADAGLWILGNYDGPNRRKLGSGVFSGEVSKGGGGDHINGEIGRRMLRYYVELGLPHLVFESKRGSEEPRTEKSKDAPTPEWMEFLRQSGIVFARLDTPPKVLAANMDRRNKDRGEDGSKRWEDMNEEQKVKYMAERSTTPISAAKRLHEAGCPTVPLEWVDGNSDAQYERLHDLLMWGGLRCGHGRVYSDADWDAYFDETCSGWRPPKPQPRYSLPLDEFGPPEQLD
jgi:hypothetical protein